MDGKDQTSAPVNKILTEREEKYGDYADVSACAQELKSIMRKYSHWDYMRPEFRESLDLIANKIARIINGNPYHKDSWEDIAGYATLGARATASSATTSDPAPEEGIIPDYFYGRAEYAPEKAVVADYFYGRASEGESSDASATERNARHYRQYYWHSYPKY